MKITKIILGGVIVLIGIWGGAFGVTNSPDASAYGVASILTALLIIVGGAAIIVNEVEKNNGK